MIPPAGASGTLLLLLDTSLTFVLDLLTLSAHPVLSCSAPPRALWAKSLPRWPHPCSLGGSPSWKQPLPSLLRLQWKYGPHTSTLSHARLVAGPLAFRLSQAQADTHQPCIRGHKGHKLSSGPQKPSPRLELRGQDGASMAQGNTPAVPLLSPRNPLSVPVPSTSMWSSGLRVTRTGLHPASL